MAFDEMTAQLIREVRQQREALDAVRWDKSFCCLKERTQKAVHVALTLGAPTPAPNPQPPASNESPARGDSTSGVVTGGEGQR